MIRGIGPAYAKKLLRAFGEKAFDVIEATPDRLREVDGIGPVRAASVLAAWTEQKAVREIMVFLPQPRCRLTSVRSSPRNVRLAANFGNAWRAALVTGTIATVLSLGRRSPAAPSWI